MFVVCFCSWYMNTDLQFSVVLDTLHCFLFMQNEWMTNPTKTCPHRQNWFPNKWIEPFCRTGQLSCLHGNTSNTSYSFLFFLLCLLNGSLIENFKKQLILVLLFTFFLTELDVLWKKSCCLLIFNVFSIYYIIYFH